ncbi:hypothetical protein [aff. Roholtiella sp. LEGE 12411]|uniref:hypothetical protein n=1 Tax=aff. Roholtiella sp. LEGE 12411 TaxID=1828822 RepID=UPI00187F685C|nr:hypothetical protein [aff. Roholtiella sp. LEGE 12411]MBE9038708.1 hypothetical protein [aff. Roholtiella sp. LEGE 12411]
MKEDNRYILWHLIGWIAGGVIGVSLGLLLAYLISTFFLGGKTITGENFHLENNPLTSDILSDTDKHILGTLIGIPVGYGAVIGFGKLFRSQNQ